MNRFFTNGKKIFSLLLIALLLQDASLFAARKKKTTVVEEEVSEEKTYINLPSEIKKRSFFADLNQSAVTLLENGSPESIKEAVQLIKKPSADYSDVEKVFLNVADRMLSIAYPSETQTWEYESFQVQSPYTGALDSVDKGIFDSSTGNADFLGTLLPAFLIFRDNISDAQLASCQQAVDNAAAFNNSSFILSFIASKIAYKKGEWEKAEQKLPKTDSAGADYQVFKAQVLVKRGRTAEAEAIALKITQEYSSNLSVLKSASYIFFAAGNFDKAEEYVARVLQQTPNNQEFLLFRARILIAKKDYIHAVSLLDMYARNNSTNLDYLILRSTVQLEWSKNTNQATETVEKALSLYPESSDALLMAARIASMVDGPVAGKYADELVSTILEKEPGNTNALSYALKGLMQRENWKEAYDISSRLVNEGKADSELVKNHVEICLKLKKNTEALNYATEQYKQNPGDETVLQAYVLAQVNAGSRNQSLQFINSLLDGSSAKMKSFLYYTRSFLQPNETAVLADLRSSLIANPRNSETLFRMYEIYYGKTDYRKAQYYLKQVVALNPNDSSVKILNENLTKLIQ
ncbi:MAG: tetratricopeptide repeat protein [Treponema sp.]|nr:tetratricopeptide repeat protein [Treponema sp.]